MTPAPTARPAWPPLPSPSSVASSPSSPPPAKGRGLSGLVGVVGVAAAALLFVNVPAEESGRQVEATVEASTIVLEHKGGPQYLRAYRDIVGVWTACDGIAYVPAGSTYTPAQCNALLERELVVHATGVLKCTPGLAAPGRDYQRAAAVSLAYNVGVAAWCKSSADRAFDAGSWRKGCDAFLLWNKAGGVVVRGLVARRQRERTLCLKGL